MDRSRPHPDAEALLAARAQRLARVEATPRGEEMHDTVVVVRLGKERLGLPATGMQGVYEDVPITPVMGTPPWFAGVAQVRGELMSVVHLSHWLGQSLTEEHPVVAVLAAQQGPIGVLVDEVLGSQDIMKNQISELLTRQAQRENRPISVLTNDLVAVVDLERFLSHPDLLVGQPAETRLARGVDEPVAPDEVRR